MTGAGAEAISVLLLGGLLATALRRLHGLVETTASIGAVAVILATGIVSLAQARAELSRLAPTVGFLAAALILSDLCRSEGLFAAAGVLMGRAYGGVPARLLALVFATAALTTAVLSLDTTVVLLTPVVLATAARLRLRSRPYSVACVHMANSASLLLPVSNLSNLLALRASGLGFAHFAALMALPWLSVIAVEWLVLRRVFGAELGIEREDERGAGAKASRPERASGAQDAGTGGQEDARVSRHVPIVLAATLVGFVVTSALGVQLVWAALAGALALAIPGLVRGRVAPGEVVRAGSLPFLVFVLALAIVVLGVERHGLGAAIDAIVPGSATFAGLLATAALGALLANLINNLPATLLLLSAVNGPAGVLAVLIGVNIGPNLSYVGSLATLLWRRIVIRDGDAPGALEFTRIGALSAPAGILAATFALWLGLQVLP